MIVVWNGQRVDGLCWRGMRELHAAYAQTFVQHGAPTGAGARTDWQQFFRT